MRKIPAAIAVLSLAAVGLTGCSLPAGGSACPRPAVSDPDVMDLVTVTGAPDSVPDVSVYAPLHTTENAYEDLVTGTGPAITSASQLAVRPDHRMVAHTGFLLWARRLAPGAVAPEVKRRASKSSYGDEDVELWTPGAVGDRQITDKNLRKRVREAQRAADGVRVAQDGGGESE